VQHLLAAIDASFRLAMLTARGHKQKIRISPPCDLP
jgi:hypothetical protein